MRRTISIKDLISISNEANSEELGSPSRYQHERYSANRYGTIKMYMIWLKLKWDKFRLWRGKRKNNFFYHMYLHITLHLLLLSIFEPIFFFQYASKIEQEVFMNQVSSYFKDINKNYQARDFSYNISSISFSVDNITKIETDVKNRITDELILYQNRNKDITNNEFNNIKENALIGKERREERGKILEKKAEEFAVLFGILFIFGAVMNIFFFRINWWKLIFEHSVLMTGIGLYELWFFKNILLKYDPLSPAEIDFILAPCLYKIASEKLTVFGIAPFKTNQTDCIYF